MIKISSAGGYEQLIYADLPECNYTQGANIKLDSKPSLLFVFFLFLFVYLFNVVRDQEISYRFSYSLLFQSFLLFLLEIDHSACVVVATHACGVNYADCIIRWGLYQSAKDFVGWPITPGFEFSGTVVQVGENVNEYKIGDKVAGVSMFGSYSKRIQVPANQIRHVPDNISMSEAAGFLTVGLTAYYAIFELCKLRKDDYVLVHSAAGGVGSMMVQMLKHKVGCNVVGVVGQTHKVALAKELGMQSLSTSYEKFEIY